MSVVKVIEVLAESDKSWEEAANTAVRHASKSLHNIRSIYIKEMEGVVEGDRVTKFRVNAKITFKLDDS